MKLTTASALATTFALLCACHSRSNSSASGAGADLPGNVVAMTLDGRLVTFDIGDPGVIRSSRSVSGIPANDWIVGLDERRSTGDLYALTAHGRLFRVDVATGVATLLSTPGGTYPIQSRSVALEVDPVADVLRVAKENERQFRVDPETGAILGEDAPIHYDVGDPNFGQDPNVVGLAYTNDRVGAVGTTLYAIDSSVGTLVRIGGVNGAPDPVSEGRMHTVGSLGIDPGGVVSFDVTPEGAGLLTVTPVGAEGSSLYSVDLTTGAARPLGAIGDKTIVRAFAPRSSRIPLVWGVTEAGELVSFRPGRPGQILSHRPITGLASDETITTIDMLASSGRLFGLTDVGRLCTIETSTAVATVLGTGLAPTGRMDVECDPVTYVPRLVGTDDTNARLDAHDGTVTAFDAPLAYAAGDVNAGLDPRVAAVAFADNRFGAPSTTLYGIDAGTDSLVRVGSVGGVPDAPSGGTLNTIGSLGVDVGELVAFDVDGSGAAFAVLNPAVGTGSFACVDLSTGVAREIGPIGTTSRVTGIAVELPIPSLVFGVDDLDRLVSFRADAPGAILSTRKIAGLEPAEHVLAVDFRPSTNELLAVTSANRLLRVDRVTGATVAVGAGLSTFPVGVRLAAEIDPSVDQLRVASESNVLVSVDPRDGTAFGSGSGLSYAAGDPGASHTPSLVSLACTDNFAGSTKSTLYGLDRAGNTLFVQAAPGEPLVTVGALSLDLSDAVGFDIHVDGLALVSNAGSSESTLYRIDLATGTTTTLGAIGGRPLRDLAIASR